MPCDRLLDALRTLTGRPDAQFRPDQRAAIETVVDRGRVLVVQRTGWGKSAVYFLATSELRHAGFGPTLLVSPLLALMRNQLEAAARLGLRAATINSANPDEHDDIASKLAADDLDLLLVSPERFANEQFTENWLPLLAARPALFVIDEIHCISDWGHDFRPDYRRLSRVLELLPVGTPVLGCTATANNRVVEDVQRQLGSSLVTIRGPLGRDGLSLREVQLPQRAERLAWLSANLESLPGSGIIYCLTINDARVVAQYLAAEGHNVVSYSGDHELDERLDAEGALLDNRVKALAATSALGMGFDKPDLGFVVHFQSPGSPVAYYQQVGRAGRALSASVGVLLRGQEDKTIQDFFIETAFASEEDCAAVVSVMERSPGGARVADIEAGVNIKRSRLTSLLKQLEADGFVIRSGGRWECTDRPFVYPHERVRTVNDFRHAEQDEMRRYELGGMCRMQFLRGMLDDPTATPCGICDVCAPETVPAPPPEHLVRRAREFLQRQFVPIPARLQWPSGVEGVHGNIAKTGRVEPGWALSTWGQAPLGDVVARGKRIDGEFSDELVVAAVEFLGRVRPEPWPTWVAAVPSQRHADLVPSLARRVAVRLGLPFVDCVEQRFLPPPQETMRNSAQQVANIVDAFAVVSAVPAGVAMSVPEAVPDGPVLLIDDVVDSRWTLTVVGYRLRLAGSGPVYPLALAAAAGSHS
jgi:ATP-dependent DNA helicase RecQ